MAGIPRQFNNPLGIGLSPQVQAGLAVRVHYTCTDPVFDVYEAGYHTRYVTATDITNGRPFSIGITPSAAPSGMAAVSGCVSGVWTRDATYYDVSIDIGWGFGAPSDNNVQLLGPVGAVAP